MFFWEVLLACKLADHEGGEKRAGPGGREGGGGGEEKKEEREEMCLRGGVCSQPASLLAIREVLRCGRSWGVGMWSPVISTFSGAAAEAAGSCLFFILALAML